MNVVRIIQTSLFALFLLAISPVQAALMSCMSGTTYSLSDATASACFTGNDTNQIDSSSVLFGMSGWILSDKNDGPDGDGLIEFTDAPVNGVKSGDWTIDTLAGLEKIVITLKAGNGFGAFLLDLNAVDPLSGGWSTGKGLSHSSIYYAGKSTPPPPPPPAVPEPAVLALMGIGLLGIGMARRKIRKQ